jgi:hypothetical protein
MRLAIIAVTILFLTGIGYAYVAEIDISESVRIYNEQNEFRILLKFDEIAIPDSFRVDFASIVLPKTQDSVEVAFEVCAVSQAWDASTVSWSYPWSKTGGDFSDTYVTRWVIHPRAGSPGHFIDVTEYIRAVVKGGADYGLIIKPAGDGETAFGTDAAAAFSGLGELKLRVLYRGKDRPQLAQ